MADEKTTSNMFIFCLEGEWRQEVAGFMGNVVVSNLAVHLFILPSGTSKSQKGFTKKKKQKKEEE